MKTIKASNALLSAVGSFTIGLPGATRLAVLALVLVAAGVQATIWESDGQTAANYQSATGTWETASIWSTNGTLLATWPGVSTDDARIGYTTQNGNFLLTIGTSVTVNSLNLSAQNGTKITITNGTLHIGAGGLTVGGNQTSGENIYSDIIFETNQTWNIAQNLTVYGGVTDAGNGWSLTKTGANTLTLANPGGNSFTGLTTVPAGVLKSMATNGVSFGSGSLFSMNMGVSGNFDAFLVAPAGSGGTANVLGGTNGNNTITFDGMSRFGLAKGSWTSVNFTFGNASDTGSAFVRSGRSALGLTGSGGSASIANDGKFLLAAANSFNTPYINPANGVVDPYLFMQGVGAQWPVDLMKYSSTVGFANVTWTTMPAAGTNDSLGLYYINVSSANSILPASSSVYAYRIGWSNVTNIFNSGVTLTIGDGSRPAGLLFTASNGAVMMNAAGASNTKIDFRGSEGIILSGAYDNSILIPIHGSNGLTIANAGGNNNKALTLGAANAYSGTTTVMGGKLQVGSGGTSGDLGNSDNLIIYSGASAVFNRSDSYTFLGNVTGVSGGTFTRNANTGALTLNNVTGGITLTDNSTTGSTVPTTINQSGTGLTIGTINGANGSVVILQGTGTNSIGNGLNTSGQTVKFNGGTWDLNADGGFSSSLEVNAGTVNKPAPSRNFYNLASFVMHGGQLISLNQYGMRMGSTFGADYATGNKFTGFQDGGLVSISGEDATLGSAAANLTNSYTLAGGTFNPANGRGLKIGAATSGAGFTQFVLTNSGTLLISGTLQGSQGAGAKQIIDFAGGTLAAKAIDATKLSAAATPTVQGTLVNNGGTLAPGNVGIPGQTTITGSYTETSVNAALAIDVGGPTQANAFTNGPAYFDYVIVNNGSAAVAGRLNVRLINGYVPLTTNRFTVLLCTNGLSGTFANLTGKILPLTDGYSLFTNVTQSATNVILSGYAVNEYLGGSWDSTPSWSQGVIPANQDYAAYFGTLASSFSPNAGTRTLKGLVFANTSSFTLSGTALTLQGDAGIKVTAGSHAISVPVALSNATEIAVAGTSVLTLSGPVTGAQNVTKTGTGTLALSGVNTLGALTISAGTVKQSAGTTTMSALTLAGGTYDLWTGTLRIAEGVAGGAIDTIAEVEAAITAGTIKGRGQTLPVSEFKITVADGYVKVELKTHGTVISFL